MLDEFEVAAGSVTGRAHVRSGRNNQDAFCWCATADGLVAVVADGCSSGARSEIGAWLGARTLAESLRRRLPRLADDAPAALDAARDEVLAQVQASAVALGGRLEDTLGEFFLFTLVGVVLTRTSALLFAAGDGVFALDGRLRVLVSPDNRPAYPAYALDGRRTPFEVWGPFPTASLRTVLVGTDGAADLAAAEERRLPGREERLGPLAQFWEDDRYYRNPYAVGRRLALANRDGDAPGLLPDDTTLVVVRRRGGHAVTKAN